MNPCGIMSARASRSRAKAKQLELPFRHRNWGGARSGAGRKPKNGIAAGVAHDPRGPLASRHPADVTMKLRSGLPKLRRKAEHAALRGAFTKGKDRFGFRLIHYAVLNDHLHLVVEAASRDSLRRGVQGLAVRIARALNKLWARRGKVFADRYHDRVLKTPREVRNALAYVMHNAKKHVAEGRHVTVPHPIDEFSSAVWFDGFRERFTVRGLDVTIRRSPTRGPGSSPAAGAGTACSRSPRPPRRRDRTGRADQEGPRPSARYAPRGTKAAAAFVPRSPRRHSPRLLRPASGGPQQPLRSAVWRPLRSLATPGAAGGSSTRFAI
jgi:putative transposase